MKKILILCLFFSLQSCAGFWQSLQKKDTILIDFAKAFTETAIQKIFKIPEFRFSNDNIIECEIYINEIDLQNILKEYFDNITEIGAVKVETLRVKTLIAWEKSSQVSYKFTISRTPKII
jgi:hypothetical protein